MNAVFLSVALYRISNKMASKWSRMLAFGKKGGLPAEVNPYSTVFSR